MLNWGNFVAQLFNGLVSGALLALISAGLTIVYGTLGVLNLAHGALFMLGGYAGFVAYQATGSFIIAAIVGALFVGFVGLIFERIIVRYFYDRPEEDQILVTFGTGIVIVELVRYFFGSLAKTVQAPVIHSPIVNLGFTIYPEYRLVAFAVVVVALGGLYLLLYRTRLGMVVRAGIEDAPMVDMLGINIQRTFMLVFGIGAMAAGFAGIINAPIISITPGVGDDILIECFVVIVIGGVGSFPGAIVGGIVAGEIMSLTSMFNPQLSQVMLYAAMTLVLIARPQGLFGTR
ncbi:MAG TPA: branched-chain amino acid ABC transporter permease [Bauldia sp.]|nr:branched-chain amino acid ABC transporter permease [Bauldia sp.]